MVMGPDFQIWQVWMIWHVIVLLIDRCPGGLGRGMCVGLPGDRHPRHLPHHQKLLYTQSQVLHRGRSHSSETVVYSKSSTSLRYVSFIRNCCVLKVKYFIEICLIHQKLLYTQSQVLHRGMSQRLLYTWGMSHSNLIKIRSFDPLP